MMNLLKTLLKSYYPYIDYKAFVKKQQNIAFVVFDKNFPFPLELGDRLELISGNLNLNTTQTFSFRIKTQNDSVNYQNFLFVVLDSNNNVIYQENFIRSQASERVVRFTATPPINVVLYNEHLEVLHTSQDIYLDFLPLNQNLFVTTSYGQQTYRFPIFITSRNLPEVVYYYRTKNSFYSTNIPINHPLDFSIYYKNSIVGIYMEEHFLSDYKYLLSYAFLETSDLQNSLKFLSPFTALMYKNLRDFYLSKISDVPEISDFSLQQLPSSGNYFYRRYVFDNVRMSYLPKDNSLDVLETLLFSYFYYKFPNFASPSLLNIVNGFLNSVSNFVPFAFYPGASINGKHIIPSKIVANNNESYYLGLNLLLLEILDMLNNVNDRNLLLEEIKDKFLDQNRIKINSTQTDIVDLALIQKFLPKYFSGHPNFSSIYSLTLNELNNSVFSVSQLQVNTNPYSNQFNPEVSISLDYPITFYSKNLWEDLIIKHFIEVDFEDLKNFSYKELVLGATEFDKNEERFILPSSKASLALVFFDITKNQKLEFNFLENNTPKIVYQSYKIFNNLLFYEVEFDKPTKAIFLLTKDQSVIKYSHSSQIKYNHVFIVDTSGLNNIYSYNFLVFPLAWPPLLFEMRSFPFSGRNFPLVQW